MSNLLTKPLGGLESPPFGPTEKCEVASAIIAAGAALAQGFMNSQVAAENQATDRAIYYNTLGKQREWNLQDQATNWKHTQELLAYDTPQKQLERYREAGLNPYIHMQGGQLVPGQSNGTPTTPPNASPGSVPQRDVRPFTDISQLLMQGSALQNDKMRSFSQLMESYPKLLEAMDGNTEKAGEIVKNLAGVSGLKGDKLYDFIKSKYSEQESKSNLASTNAFLVKKYGDKQASIIIDKTEQEMLESAARIGKMSSDSKVNDATIQKLATDCVRNIAEAWKLRREGDHYVADTETINQLRKHIVAQARLTKDKMAQDNYLSGADEDSPFHSAYGSQEYIENRYKGIQMDAERYGDMLIRAMDIVFKEYGLTPKFGANVGASVVMPR